MKEFTSAFVGIPLPEKYFSEFKDIQSKTASYCGSIKLSDSNTPHITLFYLDKQSIKNLKEVEEIVKSTVELFRKLKVNSTKLGVFEIDNPRVLFIEVIKSELLSRIHDELSKQLKQYRAQEEFLEFHPHITIGRLKDQESIIDFKNNYDILVNIYNKIKWDFRVTEVFIYGVDSEIKPERQQQLIKIKV